ncbi:MAG: hypothetical protein JW749_11375 [Sedimentisphaerales bacterium]|nr:hypothetical protein [Sedimentisphaerales bacterium]
MSKKTTISIVIILVLFVANEAQAAKDGYILKRLARLEYGSGKDQIGLLDVPDIPRSGPESFWVNDKGEIYICDTVNASIKQFSPDGKFLNEYPMGFNCSDLAVGEEGNLFVLDRSRRLLHQFTKDEKQAAVQLIDRQLMERADILSFSGNKLVMISVEQEEHEIGEFKDGKFLLLERTNSQGKKGIMGRKQTRFLTIKTHSKRGEIGILGKEGEIQKKITLPVEQVASIVFLGQDDKGNFYIQVERTKAEGIGINLSVYCLDSEGSVDSVIENIPNNYLVWTAKLLQVNANGDIYQVLPIREGVEINVWMRSKSK